MRRHAVAAAVLTVALAFPLEAQLTEVQPGARVRVEAPGIVAGRYVGTVLTRTADTVVVGNPHAVPLRIPFARITAIEISRGKSRTEGAISGIKWGVHCAGFPSTRRFRCVVGSRSRGSRVLPLRERKLLSCLQLPWSRSRRLEHVSGSRYQESEQIVSSRRCCGVPAIR